jgi:aspartate carbamoyltransferase regulatory subunit
MTSNLKLLNNHIASIKGTEINENEIKELSFLAGEIELNIKERGELIKKLELKGQL